MPYVESFDNYNILFRFGSGAGYVTEFYEPGNSVVIDKISYDSAEAKAGLKWFVETAPNEALTAASHFTEKWVQLSGEDAILFETITNIINGAPPQNILSLITSLIMYAADNELPGKAALEEIAEIAKVLDTTNALPSLQPILKNVPGMLLGELTSFFNNVVEARADTNHTIEIIDKETGRPRTTLETLMLLPPNVVTTEQIIAYEIRRQFPGVEPENN